MSQTSLPQSGSVDSSSEYVNFWLRDEQEPAEQVNSPDDLALILVESFRSQEEFDQVLCERMLRGRYS